MNEILKTFRRPNLCRTATFLCLTVALILTACGGARFATVASDQTFAKHASFSVRLTPAVVSVEQGGSQSIRMEVASRNGFKGPVRLAVSGLPSGITASPQDEVLNVEANVLTSETVTLVANSTGAIADARVEIRATSAALESTAFLTLHLSRPSRPVVRKQSVPPIPVASLGGEVLRGYLDEERQLLFVSNDLRNEVIALDAYDLSVRARIDVPQPFGIDQMADGKTLVVGTFTQSIYTIDEDTFAATAHPIPFLNGNLDVWEPVLPVAMASGKVLLLMKEPYIYADYIYGGQHIYEWDSATEAVRDLTLGRWVGEAIETLNLRRSGDHKWAVFIAYGVISGMYAYSSDTAALTRVDPLGETRLVASNFDGSQIVVGGQAQKLTLFDHGLNVIGTTISMIEPVYLQPEYSRDGLRLYLMGDTNLGGSVTRVIEIIDAQQSKTIGLVPLPDPPAGTSPSTLLAVSSAQRAYVSWDSYVISVDCSRPWSAADAKSNFVGMPSPHSIPLNADSPVTFNFLPPAGASFAFNGQPAITQNTDQFYRTVTVLPPRSTTAGPANVTLTLANGQTTVRPEAFSYGVKLADVSANFAPANANSINYLFGFGLLSANGSVPSVTIGGQAISGVTGGLVDENYHGNSLEYLRLVVPAGLTGQADIAVTGSNGSDTLHNAITFYGSYSIPATGILQLLFDSKRNKLYALKSTGVDVFDPATGSWASPLLANVSGVSFFEMALKADGSMLVLFDRSHQSFSTVNPDQPSSLTGLNAPVATAKMTVAGTNTLLALGPRSPTPGFIGKASAIDMTTLAVTQLFPPYGEFGVYTWGASSNGYWGAGVESDSGGGVVLWHDPDRTAASAYLGGGFWTDVAVSPNGIVAAAQSLSYYAGSWVAFFDTQLHYINSTVYTDFHYPSAAPVMGITFSATGETLIVPSGDAIDLFDTKSGRLRAKIMSPEQLKSFDYWIDNVGALAIDPSDQNIYVLSQTGIVVFHLPASVDKLH